MELDRVPLWRGNHVKIRQLVEDFARFLYLPRLRDPSVLIHAIQDGVGLLSWEKDSFAYAESFDEKAGRYRGLRAGENISLSDRAPVGLLVKPEVARRQFEKERAKVSSPTDKEPAEVKGKEKAPDERITEVAPAKARPKRFYAVKDLDATKAGLEASQIAKEVVAHLVGLPGAEVKITLEIQATFPEGAPEEIIRIVTENCRTLKFSSHEFESE